MVYFKVFFPGNKGSYGSGDRDRDGDRSDTSSRPRSSTASQIAYLSLSLSLSLSQGQCKSSLAARLQYGWRALRPLDTPRRPFVTPTHGGEQREGPERIEPAARQAVFEKDYMYFDCRNCYLMRLRGMFTTELL